jgi:hypothetical protein
MKNNKLKIYLKDGTYFWVNIRNKKIEANFNKEQFYLVEKDGCNLIFKSLSDEELCFEMSKNNNEEVINRINEYWENE